MVNFNIHHLIKCEKEARANTRATQLIELIDECYLSSNLPAEMPTYFSAQRNKTNINLCLTMEELTGQVMTCRTREDLDHNSDHISVEKVLNDSVKTTSQQKKYI